MNILIAFQEYCAFLVMTVCCIVFKLVTIYFVITVLANEALKIFIRGTHDKHFFPCQLVFLQRTYINDHLSFKGTAELRGGVQGHFVVGTTHKYQFFF